MTNRVHQAALTLARKGWPVFPCLPDRKWPATSRSHADATTDPDRIDAWFAQRADLNLAVATGAPGPDVLDAHYYGAPDADGLPAIMRLERAGLLDGATAVTRTPSGGMHWYFPGTGQQSGQLHANHLAFYSQGSYVLVPPSTTPDGPYRSRGVPGKGSYLDWPAAVRHLDPERDLRPDPDAFRLSEVMGKLTNYVELQPESNRNSALFWAAVRALEVSPNADLIPLAASARQAGLPDADIWQTLDYAQHLPEWRSGIAGHEAEGAG